MGRTKNKIKRLGRKESMKNIEKRIGKKEKQMQRLDKYVNDKQTEITKKKKN